VFATAGKAVVEAKPIAAPTIKYEIGPLLKDWMEWPSPPKSAYVIGELMAGNNPYGFDILSGRNNKNQSPGWLVSLVIGDYLAWFGEHFLGEFFVAKCYGLNAELLTLLVWMGVYPKVFLDCMHTSVSNLVQHGKFH
jgi:hypothetical protein